MLHEENAPIQVSTKTVVCEGNGGAFGHPRVFLDVKKEGFVVCPYCSCRYELEDRRDDA